LNLFQYYYVHFKNRRIGKTSGPAIDELSMKWSVNIMTYHILVVLSGKGHKIWYLER